jgi:hypothetical protein
MPSLFQRETFIALRARRQAHVIARDILNPHVEVNSITCRDCGGEVPVAADHLGVRTRCPQCGTHAMLPSTFFADPDEPVATVAPTPRAASWSAFQCVCLLLLWVLGLTLLVALALAFSE